MRIGVSGNIGLKLLCFDIRRDPGCTRGTSIIINQAHHTRPCELRFNTHAVSDGSGRCRGVQLNVVLTLLYGADNL